MEQVNEPSGGVPVSIVQIIAEDDNVWYMVFNPDNPEFRTVSQELAHPQITGAPFFYRLDGRGGIDFKSSQMAEKMEDWIGPVRIGNVAMYQWFEYEVPLPDLVDIMHIEEVNIGTTGRVHHSDGTLAQPACVNCFAFKVVSRTPSSGYQYACKAEDFIGECRMVPPTAKAGEGYKFPELPGNEYCANFKGLAPGVPRWNPQEGEEDEEPDPKH